jgi:hypothetical protein
MAQQALKILDSLSELERKVVETRFGLKDGRDMTVEEVADELGLKPERVRNLEAKALRNLRNPGLIYYDEEQGISLWVEEEWTDNYDKILNLLKEHYNERLKVEEGNGCQIMITGKELDKFASIQSVDEQLATLKSFHDEFLGVIEQTL